MRSKPYTKREIRARVRETRLRELGYEDYPAYLRSTAWRDLKERYRASDLPQICMCGDTQVQLHHTTYERVGRESLEDLIPLCRDCHAHAHALEAAGVIELDLRGFYFDATRAEQGKRVLASLNATGKTGDEMRAEKRATLAQFRLDKRKQRLVMFKRPSKRRKVSPASARPEDLQRRTFKP